MASTRCPYVFMIPFYETYVLNMFENVFED